MKPASQLKICCGSSGTPQRRGAGHWLLDITTDVGVPSVAAVSCRAMVPVLPSASRRGRGWRPRCAPRLRRCANSSWPDSVVATKRSERGDGALNTQDRTHLRRAMINADPCILLQPVAERATHLSIHATEAGDIFGLIVQRLEKLGIETFSLDLTRRFFGVPVVRVIAPGLQLEPSEIVTARLRDAIARTGGGAIYTGGVALI